MPKKMNLNYSRKRFWSKVKRTNNCWIWQAGLQGKGYGSFWHNGKSICAHRFAWELVKGAIPKGTCVLHKCDNSKCVNPDCLFLGSVADNNKDKSKKGRHRNQYTKKSTCRGGHPWTKGNTLWHSNGISRVRRCRKCYNAYRRKAKEQETDLFS